MEPEGYHHRHDDSAALGGRRRRRRNVTTTTTTKTNSSAIAVHVDAHRGRGGGGEAVGGSHWRQPRHRRGQPNGAGGDMLGAGGDIDDDDDDGTKKDRHDGRHPPPPRHHHYHNHCGTSLRTDLRQIVRFLHRLILSVRRTILSSPLSTLFALLWLWALRSWYVRLVYGTSSYYYSEVESTTGVIAYSLYDDGGAGVVDPFGGGGGGDDYAGSSYGSDGESGSNRYLQGVLANAQLLPHVYPGWSMRIYHDGTVPTWVLEELRGRDGVELFDVGGGGGGGGGISRGGSNNGGGGGGGQDKPNASSVTNKMMWRFAIASDPTIPRYCVRDVDSRLSPRERVAVDEWISSRKKFHVMRDHPSHSANVMSGGLWCATRDAVPDMVERILQYQERQKREGSLYGGGWEDSPSRYMADMDFLSYEVWPIAKRSLLQHDAFSCNNYPSSDSRGFPTLRKGGEHVGSVYIDGKVRQGDVDILMDALSSPGRQPRQCRDRNVIDVKGAVSDADGMAWSSPLSGGGGSINGGGGGADLWGQEDNLDQNYNQMRREFDGLQSNRPPRQQQGGEQDMNKPITNIGGRTCFKYTRGTKPERRGQITSDTTFGAALRDVARRPDVKRIIETGAWYGGGSTHEFAEGIRSKANCATNATHHCCEAFVVSFEIFEAAIDHARLYHQDNPVWIVKGSTVGVGQMAKDNDIPEEERNGEHFQLYYERDRELMSQASPKLEKFCNFIRPDVVLVDGNEYTGWAEFKVAMNTCRPRYIALHDTGTFKTKKVEKFIRNKKPELFEVIASGEDAVSWSIYRYKQPDVIGDHGFRIIVLTQRRYWSLERLLKSIDATDYGDAKVELEIRIDYDESEDYQKTVEVAEKFTFRHGTKHIHKYTRNEGLQLAWLNAWKPASDDERAVIIEDDLELSPLWFIWLRKAWSQYGGRADVGGISLCRQRLRASDGQHIMVERSEPFLYRLPGSFGFSPNARYWREFMNWVRTTDVQHADLNVPGTVTSDWYRSSPDFWEQAWIWWCWTNGRAFYTLYAHSMNGALVGHWAEPGVHSDESNENAPERNDELLQAMEPLLESFPPDLQHFGWNFEVESGGWEGNHYSITTQDFTAGVGTDDTDMYAPDAIDDAVGAFDAIDSMDGSKYVAWTNDFHIATVANVKSLLEPKGVKFIDKSLSGHCHETNTCATDLKILTSENGMNPDSYTRQRFVEAYKDDWQMAKVDVVMCFHPSSMCELFMPLKKRLFVIASTRYELGRESAGEWREWNKNLVEIAADGRNLIATNNLYDAKYIEYFTGLKPVLLPSWIKMNEDDMYTGISDDILIAPMHSSSTKAMTKKLKSISSRFTDMHAKYGHYTFSQLAENTAIIYIPYQVSLMSLFEQYAMGIPILAPTPEFLWELHEKLDVMNERTWERIRTGARPRNSAVPGVKEGHDPNNDVDRDAFLHWIKYADFYQWPHIIHFNSWKDLRRKLEETDWEVVSDEMLGFVKRAIDKTSQEWTRILDQTDNYAPLAQHEEAPTSDLATYLSEFMKSAHIW